MEASLAHLKIPEKHRKYVRTTNLIERAFEEERRRTKVLPRFFDEKSALKLSVFGSLEGESKMAESTFWGSMNKNNYPN